MLLPPIRFEPRSSLYFGRWHYVIRLRVPEAWLLRTLDESSIHRRIRNREEYFRIQGQEPFWSSHLSQQLDYVFRTADQLRNLSGEFLHRIVYSGTVHVYTNSVEHIVRLFQQHPDSEVRQAEVSIPADVVILKSEPRYPYRTYFKERDITENQKRSLWNWVQAQDTDLEPSPTTKRWLNGTSKWNWHTQWCRKYYYVEHTDISHVMMLNLVCTGLVRKTMRVLKQP